MCHEARHSQRAEAYLDSTSSTASERDEADTALSRAAGGRVVESRPGASANAESAAPFPSPGHC
jgi:hypothetical protein